MRGNKSTIRLCRTHRAVREVAPSGPCPGDRYSARPCPNVARFRLKGAVRCARHTVSVLHDMPVVWSA